MSSINWSSLDATHQTLRAAADNAQRLAGIPAERRRPAQIDIFGAWNRAREVPVDPYLAQMRQDYPIGHVIYVNGQRWGDISGHDPANRRLRAQCTNGDAEWVYLTELQQRADDVTIVTPEVSRAMDAVERTRVVTPAVIAPEPLPVERMVRRVRLRPEALVVDNQTPPTEESA